ncbi:unnamed protein product [Amoebophrya sp. A120]|nr:unnamed protein product [Amoebophrya sp. A120]|eukprot:GSA120T00003863001.1
MASHRAFVLLWTSAAVNQNSLALGLKLSPVAPRPEHISTRQNKTTSSGAGILARKKDKSSLLQFNKKKATDKRSGRKEDHREQKSQSSTTHRQTPWRPQIDVTPGIDDKIWTLTNPNTAYDDDFCLTAEDFDGEGVNCGNVVTWADNARSWNGAYFGAEAEVRGLPLEFCRTRMTFDMTKNGGATLEFYLDTSKTQPDVNVHAYLVAPNTDKFAGWDKENRTRVPDCTQLPKTHPDLCTKLDLIENNANRYFDFGELYISDHKEKAGDANEGKLWTKAAWSIRENKWQRKNVKFSMQSPVDCEWNCAGTYWISVTARDRDDQSGHYPQAVVGWCGKDPADFPDVCPLELQARTEPRTPAHEGWYAHVYGPWLQRENAVNGLQLYFKVSDTFVPAAEGGYRPEPDNRHRIGHSITKIGPIRISGNAVVKKGPTPKRCRQLRPGGGQAQSDASPVATTTAISDSNREPLRRPTPKPILATKPPPPPSTADVQLVASSGVVRSTTTAISSISTAMTPTPTGSDGTTNDVPPSSRGAGSAVNSPNSPPNGMVSSSRTSTSNVYGTGWAVRRPDSTAATEQAAALPIWLLFLVAALAGASVVAGVFLYLYWESCACPCCDAGEGRRDARVVPTGEYLLSSSHRAASKAPSQGLNTTVDSVNMSYHLSAVPKLPTVAVAKAANEQVTTYQLSQTRETAHPENAVVPPAAGRTSALSSGVVPYTLPAPGGALAGSSGKAIKQSVVVAEKQEGAKAKPEVLEEPSSGSGSSSSSNKRNKTNKKMIKRKNEERKAALAAKAAAPQLMSNLLGDLRSAAAGIDSRTTAHPDSRATAQPDSRTTAQPDSRMTTQPDSRTTTQPESEFPGFLHGPESSEEMR